MASEWSLLGKVLEWVGAAIKPAREACPFGAAHRRLACVNRYTHSQIENFSSQHHCDAILLGSHPVDREFLINNVN